MEGHFCYSPELISRLIAYFQKRGVILPPEEADRYLNSLAELYRCLEKSTGLSSMFPSADVETVQQRGMVTVPPKSADGGGAKRPAVCSPPLLRLDYPS